MGTPADSRPQAQNPDLAAVHDKFMQGMALHRQGKLADAERVYEEVLRREPRHFDALHFLGLVAIQTRRTQRGIDLIEKAIRLKPDVAVAYNNLGKGFADLKRLPEALASFDKAIALDPAYVEAHNNRATALRDLQRFDEARASYDKAAALRSEAAAIQAQFQRVPGLYQQGRLAEAEQICEAVLRRHPGHFDALHLLGVIALKTGRPQRGVELISRAIRVNPEVADAYSNLGSGLRELGAFEEALASYDKAIALAPHHAEAYFNRGTALRALGRFEEAVASYDRALALRPDYPTAYNNRGNALSEMRRLEEALASYGQAIALNPGYVEAYNNRGTALSELQRFEEAIADFQQAIRIAPDDADAHFNLGKALHERGESAEAVDAYRQAIRIRPDYAEAHYNLGTVLAEQGRLAEAVDAYAQAIGIKPDFAEAHSNLGNALNTLGRTDEAMAAYRRAVAANPDHAEAHYNLANALSDCGRFEEAIAQYRRATGVRPEFSAAHSNLGGVLNEQGRFEEAIAACREAVRVDAGHAQAHCNLAFCLNYGDAVSAAELFAAHRSWHAQVFRTAVRPTAYANARDGARRLRIGYVSPDFRQHSVAYFLAPLLAEHDRQAVEVYGYAEVEQPDAATARLQQHCDHWLVTVGLSDTDLAERIRADGIDILVDLAGYTAKNRLGVFARKPAPVQATWLGYPNTTGLEAIDYRLVDAVTDPPGEADALATETLVRLDGGFLCYAGAPEAPEPAAPPCLATGIVTFGSFNNPAKLSPATLDAWGTLLDRLPHARLLLKAKPFTDPATCALFLARLAERGVPAERVELAGRLPDRVAHLAFYDRVDIALDPFPYNGTTTTCEALWMGVPVVTLRGDQHRGRVGASLLTQAGLVDFIAESVGDYVNIAAALADDPQRLADLRRTLRPRLTASSLCDASAFARKIEAAYRSMWRRWCESAAASAAQHENA